MLNKDPTKRLGYNGYQDILNHKFFSSLNIELLKTKQLTPPYIPQIGEDRFDVSNFEQELT